jgi:RimJ/RimL family protein N-acetyltransferase
VDSRRPTELGAGGAITLASGAVADGPMSERLDLPALADAPWIVEGTTRSETGLLTIADQGELERVHRAIVARAPAGTVALETSEFLASHLGADGYTVGLFFEGQLVAYGILGLSGAAHARLGGLLGLSARRCERLAILDGVGVVPAFRGRGAHRYLNRVRDALAERHGRRLLAASAAPANTVSWRNLMRLGLEVRGLARMFGGHWRYLMLRDESRMPADAPAELVDALDIARQQRLLDLGCRGVRADQRRGRPAVDYAAGALARPRGRSSR